MVKNLLTDSNSFYNKQKISQYFFLNNIKFVFSSIRYIMRSEKTYYYPCVCFELSDILYMRKFSFIAICCFVMFLPTFLWSQNSGNQNSSSDANIKKLYKLPNDLPVPDESHILQNILAGTESGLYKIIGNDTPEPLWNESRVTQIVETYSDSKQVWFFVSGHGLLRSEDLETFTVIGADAGLPMLTLKEFVDGEVKLIQRAKEIKDLAVHPQNHDILVATTDNAVYLTENHGKTWKNLGFSARTAGAKAVAVADMAMPGRHNKDGSPVTELTVFLSHPIYGLSYIHPNRGSSNWIDLVRGFTAMPTQGHPDELADILPVVRKNEDGYPVTEIYVSQTFLPNIFRVDWEKKQAIKIYEGAEPADTIDGLGWTGSNLIYTSPGKISMFNVTSMKNIGVPSDYSSWQKSLIKVPEPVYTAYIPKNQSGFSTSLVLNELWMLKPQRVYAPYGSDKLNQIKSLYVSANQGRIKSGQDEVLQILKDNKLNSIVIDMKDDYGLLRYDTQDELVKEKGYVSRYAVDLDPFVEKFKKEGIYLIARIVVFKDKHLSQYDGNKYAIWNKSSNSRWVGIKGEEEITDEEGNVTGTETLYYDEHWVDPYCHEVWEYNVAVAQELIRRGFDEIQFDYIRFPTDGTNLWQASYRWQDRGMDKESALISFLSYARDNIQAPIGIDIYGANGWYRSGTRTGQDVELLSEYVDVICPMFYPSHFEQPFLAHAPAAERPYRIYFYGTYRNSIIARNKSVIRPWLQAFYLGVSYDKKYYNEDYVQRQVFGVRDAANHGYMYWNNSGRYDDVRPDVSDTEPYPWDAEESDLKYRKPALTGVISAEKKDEFVTTGSEDGEKTSVPSSTRGHPAGKNSSFSQGKLQ